MPHAEVRNGHRQTTPLSQWPRIDIRLRFNSRAHSASGEQHRQAVAASANVRRYMLSIVVCVETL